MRYKLDPNTSIATEIHALENAVLAPPKRNRNWVVEASVFDENGAYFEPAICWHYQRNRASVDAEYPSGDQIVDLPGTYLFGGVYNPHFGHFLCETTSRLWALDFIDEQIDGILFFPAKLNLQEQASKDFATYSRLIGRELPYIIPEKPTRVGRLLVPRQGFGAQKLMYGSPEYRSFVANNFGKTVKGKGIDNIYISRTNFDTKRGSILGETVLEDHLRDEGYTIFHPQEHSLEEQVAHYKSAKNIIGPDGSPFHLVAMSSHPEMKVGIIQRRPANEYQMLARHLSIFGVEHLAVIKGTGRGWAPGGIRRAGLSVSGVVSFAALSEALRGNEMISSDTKWDDLKNPELDEFVVAMGKELDRDMYEVTNPNQSLSHLPDNRGNETHNNYKIGEYPIE